jgi:hypothetical protein
MSLRVPAVKVSDNRYFFRIRGPQGKISPFFPVNGQAMGPKLIIEVKVVPLFEEVDIMVCK